MLTSTVQRNGHTIPVPLNSLELYMSPNCTMVHEWGQIVPLPNRYIVYLPCPFIEKNLHRKLPRCTKIDRGLMCWTKKIPAHVKVICPDCTYGLTYHHTYNPEFFQYALSTTFPAANTRECNHRSFRNNPKAYTPLKTPQLNHFTHRKNSSKTPIKSHKKPYR